MQRGLKDGRIQLSSTPFASNAALKSPQIIQEVLPSAKSAGKGLCCLRPELHIMNDLSARTNAYDVHVLFRSPKIAVRAEAEAAGVPATETEKAGNSFEALKDIEAIQEILPHR